MVIGAIIGLPPFPVFVFSQSSVLLSIGFLHPQEEPIEEILPEEEPLKDEKAIEAPELPKEEFNSVSNEKLPEEESSEVPSKEI